MKKLLIAASFALAASAAHVSHAQTYPNKPVRLVVPSSPGGGTDITARILAAKLSELLEQQVVVENRAGAGSRIGNELVARSAPDGYTLLMGISAIAIIPSIHRQLRYDVFTDFAPISQVVALANVLVVHPSIPARDVKQLIGIAKSKPGQLVSGSAGVGSNPHLSLELFKVMAGTDIRHAPYQGSGRGLIGLLGGEIALMFPSVPTVMSQIQAGKLRALGVTTAQRNQGLPDVPTIAEAGLPGYEATQWFGVLAPAGTARPTVERLHKEIAAALRSAEVAKSLRAEGAEPVGSTPQAFAAFIRSEADKWAKVIKSAGIAQQ